MDENLQKNVLVVDDDPNVLESTSSLLTKNGYTVTACSTAEDALAKIRGNHFDVVLSDIKMPEVSGIELLDKIHEINSGLPVILMTAYAEVDVAVNAISKGAFDFLIKPSPPDYLLHSIKKAFQHNNYLKLKENYMLRLEDTVRQRTTALESEISESIRITNALMLSEQHLHALASRLQKVEEAERKKLARDLHDKFGQNLTALSLNLNIIQDQLSAESLERVGDRLKDSMVFVEEIAALIRDVMDDLRPDVLDDYGLVPALLWYGDRFTNRTGVTVKVHGDGSAARLTEEVKSALFNISKEALNNVAKHAEAKTVTMTIEMREHVVHLTITDDGKGFNTAAIQEPGRKSGWGLLIMQERAKSIGGQIRVESQPGEGTIVLVEVEV